MYCTVPRVQVYQYILIPSKYLRYLGKRNGAGEPAGEGALLYENKDTFQGTFTGAITNREEPLEIYSFIPSEYDIQCKKRQHVKTYVTC